MPTQSDRLVGNKKRSHDVPPAIGALGMKDGADA